MNGDSYLFPAVDAFAGAGFVDGDGVEEGDLGFEIFPDPVGDVFGGGVFEAGDFVEEAVVELIFEGAEFFLEFAEVHEPAGVGIDGAADGDFDAEGVAVEAGAFVAWGDVGQGMRGLEAEFLGQFDGEGL
jgi:hypothetical protein